MDSKIPNDFLENVLRISKIMDLQADVVAAARRYREECLRLNPSGGPLIPDRWGIGESLDKLDKERHRQ